MKRFFRPLILSLVVLIASCTNEGDNSLTKVNYLPKVKHSEKTNLGQISQIKNSQMLQSGRVNETLDYNQAITAQYEGHEEMQFVFIPSNSVSDEYVLYSFKDNILTSLSLKIRNLENSMIISNEAGEVVIEMENNYVRQINVSYTDTDITSGRVAYKCDPAKDFIAYEGAIQQQLVDSVGSWGALAIDIGCSLWVVCRGAVVAAGIIYAAGNCAS